MASDLSSGCTEVIEILDEKEEGEISLEDVSSSEEGQLNEASNSRRRAAEQCPLCSATKHCASWCRMRSKRSHSKSSTKKDAVQEKENCHHTKDSGYSGSKNPASTLQENNNDLIPISSDSDMEIVGLADSAKPSLAIPQTKATSKVRKRRRKRRPQNNSTNVVENHAVLDSSNITVPECSLGTQRDSQILKDNHLPRVHHRASHSPHKFSATTFSRSRITKSPPRRHRSPLGRTRSPISRKSPLRRPRSPLRRSPPFSPLRSPSKRTSRNSQSPPDHPVDKHKHKFLKKVRHLSSENHLPTRNSSKRKGHGSSLKDKLNNMMKSSDGRDFLGNETTGATHSEKKFDENVDDEEDLALLRKMALETKPKRTQKDSEEVTETREQAQLGNNDIEDDDVEDLELRMIALRSAMLKKHQNRVQRGVVPGKTKKLVAPDRNNSESPFSQSFLDSIPIPGEDNDERIETALRTPTQVLNENTNPEDMELDSEVELEKEKGSEPYSPTDDISREMNMDSELLGIQPSDVSFITPSSQTTILPNSSNFQTSECEKIEILETRASYLANNVPSKNNDIVSSHTTYYPDANVLPSSQSPTSSVYSPVEVPETLENNFCTQSEDNLNATPYSPSQPIDTPKMYLSAENDTFFNSDPHLVPDTPYSPTDTPMYDIEMNNSPLLLNPPPFHKSETVSKVAVEEPKDKHSKKWRRWKHQSALINIQLVPNLPKVIDTPSSANGAEILSSLSSEISETSSMKGEVGSAYNSSENSPDGTMIVVAELPETDLDGSPLVPVSREIQDIEIHIFAPIPREIRNMTQEPLYLQGVPDVTKDANKIPTLVNRSLVPASILKSNKNLQQPLPPKKIEAHLEPAFKSAEMQPVQISTETTKTNRLFKPIKLAPVIKKPQLRIVTPAAFNCSSNDNSVLEEQEQCENDKSAQGRSKNATGNPLESSQAANKTWGTTDLVQTENSAKTAKPLSDSEFLKNTTQVREKNDDTLEICNRRQTGNVGVNFGQQKKTRSRRSRSNKNRGKQPAKTPKDVKNIENKDTTTNTLEATIRLTSADTSSLHKQNLLKDSVRKKRNLREKFKKPEPEKNRRDKEDRKDRRSGHRFDEVLKSPKNKDANKLGDRRMSSKKQQPESLQGSSVPIGHRNDSVSQNYSRDEGNANDKKIITPSLDIHENMANDQRLDSLSSSIAGRTSSELKKTNVDISNSQKSSNVETPSDPKTQDKGDSASNDTAYKKVEANKRRRSSLDDDEEALRAILLASLAKRSKPSEPVDNTSKTTVLANLSHTSADTSTESVKGLPNTPQSKIPVNAVYSSSSDSATPQSLGNDNSILNNTPNTNSNSETPPLLKTPDTAIVGDVISCSVTNHRELAPALSLLKRRSMSTSSKASLKKITKKVPISASTKVVNNAKKYQNTLVQKKLNLQKVALITNAQKTLSQTNLLNNKVLDGARSRSLITKPLSDTHRFVINLASDSESENETETLNKNPDKSVNTNKPEQKPVLAIPMSDFEKSVDLFLKDVRKKQETAAATKPSSTAATVTQKPASPVTSVPRKSPVLSTTPLAVRHLPVSLQQEYRRLKQQIIEREKLKLQRVLVNNMSPLSPSSKSSGTPPGPLSPASPIASPTTSKQTHNVSPSSMVVTVVKENSSRSVNIQNNIKSIVASNVPTKTSPAVSKINAPVPSVSNLSIQIPNEITNVNLTLKKSTNSYIPASTSQTRPVATGKLTQDILNTKDSKNSVIPVKDQLSLKNVQVQLQQGKTGRRVNLGENLNVGIKTTASISKAKETGTQESVGNEASVILDSDQKDKSVKDSDNVDADNSPEKCDNSVNSSASTLIISRDGNNARNNISGDSSTSTVIIPRNTNPDSLKSESVNSDISKANSHVSKSSIIRPRKSRNNTETWEKIRGDVSKEIDAISALPTSEQKSYLANVEQNLVKKRYAILDDLSEISGNLRQLEMEREVQSNMVSEVKKLQEQLKLAEERLQVQRDHVNKMVPNISAAYEKFNDGRRECVKMTRICLGLGCLVIGANYKIPAAGVQLLNNRLKQVAGCTRQLSNKKICVTENAEEVRSRNNPKQASSSIENCLGSPSSESTPSTIHGNSTQESDDSGKVASVTVTEGNKNVDDEIAVSVEAEQTDIPEQETLRLEESREIPFAESISDNSPQLTSTPNYLKENSNIESKNTGDTLTNVSTFVLDSPEAGTSGKKNYLEQQRRILQPYKSVLNHLKVPRTTDTSGILCPYELMGTCRDEECQFVHQSARNG